MCTVFPYCVNDNVKGDGGMSRSKIDTRVVWGYSMSTLIGIEREKRRGIGSVGAKKSSKMMQMLHSKDYIQPDFVRRL